MLSTIGRAAIRRVGAGASYSLSGRVGELTWQFQRVCITQSLHNAIQAHSSQGLRTTYSVGRSYATAAKTPSTTRAKKASSTNIKKPAARVGPKVAAKSKARAKPKKKAAVKPKSSAKKVLTEEQKAKRADKRATIKAKLDLKELRAAALLSPPKALPATAWTVLLSEDVKTQKSEMGKDFTGATNVIKGAATKYKSLSSAERERYNHIANQNKQSNEAAYKQWVESHTPDQIRIANAARLRLKRKESKAGSQKFASIQDSRLPKRATNARALFTADRWATGDLKGIPLPEASKTINEEWNALSTIEKKHFEDNAAAERTRYEQEYRTVFHQEIPSHRKAAAAAAAAA